MSSRKSLNLKALSGQFNSQKPLISKLFLLNVGRNLFVDMAELLTFSVIGSLYVPPGNGLSHQRHVVEKSRYTGLVESVAQY